MELTELYIKRGELLDWKYERTLQLMSGKGFFTTEDTADIDEQIRAVSDEIAIAETRQWLIEEEGSDNTVKSGLIEAGFGEDGRL